METFADTKFQINGQEMNYWQMKDYADTLKVCPYRHHCERREAVIMQWHHSFAVSLDNTIEPLDTTKCEVCDAFEQRQALVKNNKQPSFLVVAYGISRHYGGPEEGGWYYDRNEILEVRRVYTWQGGLKAAREMRQEYPSGKYNRYSCANRGEPDVFIRCVYSEVDPRMPQENFEKPRYE